MLDRESGNCKCCVGKLLVASIVQGNVSSMCWIGKMVVVCGGQGKCWLQVLDRKIATSKCWTGKVLIAFFRQRKCQLQVLDRESASFKCWTG